MRVIGNYIGEQYADGVSTLEVGLWDTDDHADYPCVTFTIHEADPHAVLSTPVADVELTKETAIELWHSLGTALGITVVEVRPKS